MAVANAREMKEKGLVEIYVPLNDRDRKDKYMILSVNDEKIQVMRGEANWVAPKFKAEFDRKMKMRKKRDMYKDELEAKMNEKATRDGALAQ
jgi:hypothetical protein